MLLKLTRVIPSPLRRMKWRAEWSNGKHTDFGARGYSDYTIHRDKNRRRLYRIRHAKDRLNEPLRAGALSWYILWGESTSRSSNIRSFKKMFDV